MLIGEPSTFHDSMKPIIYVNCLAGMGVHQLTNISNTTYICIQLYTVIVILMNWIAIYMQLTWSTDISEYRTLSPTAFKMYGVIFCTNSCITVISPLLVRYQKKGLVNCLRQMPMLDVTFQDILGARCEYRKQYIRLICQVLAIVLVMSLTGIANTVCLMINEESQSINFAVLVGWHYPIIFMLVLDLNFCTMVGYLQKKFRDLNDGLLGLAEEQVSSHSGKRIFVVPRKVFKVTSGCQSNDSKADSFINDSHYMLYEIRKLHLELCKLFRKINLTFGLQNLLSMGMSFGMVTGLLYTTYSALSLENSTTLRTTKTVPPVTWTIIYAFKIWVVNYTCWSCSNETKRTGDVIYELLETRVDKEIEQEIQQFAVQMLQNPVSFNACGFFTLDYTFVQGVIGSITTYLIILIQMSSAPESSTSNTALDRNSTEISANY